MIFAMVVILVELSLSPSHIRPSRPGSVTLYVVKI
jgi:hypothetical protein